MINRYNFNTIFLFNPQTGVITTLHNVRINGVPFPTGTAIPMGIAFGGLDLYSLRGRDIAGIWDDRNNEISIVGFY